jgi:protein-tyrosine phosphatase
MPVVDATRIVPGIYQGGLPPTGPWVRYAGFDVLVLAAEEYQPSGRQFPGVRVYHLPMKDDLDPVSRREARSIRALSQMLALHRRRGARVLITCAAGLNRSGIITAATLRRLTGAPHRQIVDHIRARRSPRALSNPQFVRAFTEQHLGSVHA